MKPFSNSKDSHLHLCRIKFISLVLLTIAVAVANVLIAFGQDNPPTLYPPTGLTWQSVECFVYLQWQKPQLPNGSTPVGLIGYYISRDGAVIHYNSSPDSLTYWDYDVDWGPYTYTLTANYDLTSYGTPGQFGQSPSSSPLMVNAPCDYSFPFYEPWDAGTFSFQSWKFIPSQGNWYIDVTQGNPLPTVVFNGVPVLQNYDFTLHSFRINGIGFLDFCAAMVFEFDYKLTDITGSGTEKLKAQYYVDSTWFPVVEFQNSGAIGWSHQTLELPNTFGKIFKIGFRASGQNSANISGWSVDNIRVHLMCYGPINCNASRTGNKIHLTWEPPCESTPIFPSGYNVYRSETLKSGPYTKLNSALVAGTEFFDNIPPGYPNSKFWYFVTLVQHHATSGQAVCVEPCDTMEVDLVQGTGEPAISCISVYPSPATDCINVTSPYPITSCELVYYTGKIAMRMNTPSMDKINLNVAMLPAGIYLLKIKSASQIFFQKVPVMH